MDDVGFALRCHRIHAFDVLEEEILSDKSSVLDGLHRVGGIFHLGHHVLL